MVQLFAFYCTVVIAGNVELPKQKKIHCWYPTLYKNVEMPWELIKQCIFKTNLKTNTDKRPIPFSIHVSICELSTICSSNVTMTNYTNMLLFLQMPYTTGRLNFLPPQCPISESLVTPTVPHARWSHSTTHTYFFVEMLFLLLRIST